MFANSAVKRAVLVLATSQALSQTVIVLMITLSALVGRELAPSEALSTLPVAVFVLGTAGAMIPASLFMGRFGRRPGFMIGAAGALVSGLAVTLGSFTGFAAGSFLLGMYQGVSQYYRFAAADVADTEFRSRAISWVLAGGVVAAIAGPEIAKRAADWGAVTYAAPFFVATGLAVAALPLL